MPTEKNGILMQSWPPPPPTPKIYYQIQHVKVSWYIIFMLYVFHCLQTFLLFSERLNWKNNNTSNLETFSFKMSHDLATKLIVGKIMFRFNDQCRFYILGQGSTYLFIYYSYVYLYSKYVAANAFGIRKYLRNTRKSVTNWVTHLLLYTLHWY